MARPASQHPTESELAILKVLWKTGSATVRTVRDALAEESSKGPETNAPAAAKGPEFPALTTVTTMLNIMVDKGYLERVKEGPRFEYRALVSAEENSARMVTDLVSRVFDGSPAALVLNLLERDELDPAELQTLRALIDKKVREGSDRKP